MSSANAHRLVVSLVATGILLPSAANAQGTPADYARALALRARYEGAATDIAGAPTAIGRTHRFWYRKSVKGGEQFMLIDADTKQKQPAFDHDKVARALSGATGNSYTALTLPFTSIAFTEDGAAFTATVAGAPYRCSVADSSCRKADAGPRGGAGLGVGRRIRDESPRISPDGAWEALINNHNVAIRKPGTHKITHLSTDGTRGRFLRAVLDRLVAGLEKTRGVSRPARLPSRGALRRVVA